MQGPVQYEVLDLNMGQHAHYELSVKEYSYVPTHWHDAIEIIDLLDGELAVEVGGRRFNLVRGQCILLNPCVPHATISIHGNTAILLQIPVSDLSRFIPDIQTRQLVFDPFANCEQERMKIQSIQNLLEEIKETEKQRPYGYVLHLNSLMMEILYQLYHNFSYRTTQANHNSNRKNYERLSKVIDYTEKNYQTQIGLKDVAELIHLQENYFCRFFRNTMGMNYKQYLNEYRLSKVYHDLMVTDIPLSQLLEQHGFKNYKLFRQMFNDRFQATPGEIRNRKT